MPLFRATIERVQRDRMVVEISAASVREAAQAAEEVAGGVTSRRGVTVVKPYDADGNATEEQVVVAVQRKA